ncbi:hypothetical protein GCM10007901_06540 [Dyella acidisoli]|uniref:Uncharacterized protein n=1 Tax=Dyella acidisoli TaxID=1867834 RepID=A0ABQ5XKH9_9GAMM|nr:hypothetical protein GCM10007901_06540 [Dyella acidisoli]
MVLGNDPTTRLSVADVAFGAWNVTDWPLPTLKLFQLMTALLLVWWISVLLPFALMVALPAITCPPVGPPASATLLYAAP